MDLSAVREENLFSRVADGGIRQVFLADGSVSSEISMHSGVSRVKTRSFISCTFNLGKMDDDANT